ncbi:7043_t:CDS:2, partial [Gigaspora rosea]
EYWNMTADYVPKLLTVEGVVANISSVATSSCSAGFSEVNAYTEQKYLITSACFFPPNPQNMSIYHTLWLPPFAHQEAFDFFGIVREFQFLGIDFALIEKFNDEFKIKPMLKNSDYGFSSYLINSFNINRVPPSYMHIWVAFNFIIRAKISASERDVGSTVYSNEIHNESLFILVHGIVTFTDYSRYKHLGSSSTDSTH